MTEEETAVERGAAFLANGYGSDWKKRLTRPVNVRSIADCPLAQVSGSPYGLALRKAGLPLTEAAALGFTIQPHADYTPATEASEVFQQWERLQQAWEAKLAGESESAV